MLQRLGIRGKLLAVVAVPVIVLVAISVFIVSTSVTDYNSARNAAQMIDVLGTARNATEQLSEERWAAVNYVNTVSNAQAGFTSGVADTETQLAALDAVATRAVERALVERVYEELGGRDAVLAAERKIQLQPPADPDDPAPWLVFPDQDQVAAAAQSYAAKASAVEEIGTDPDAWRMQSQFSRLVFAIRFEGQQFTALNADGLPFQEQMKEVYPKVDAAFEKIFSDSEDVSDSERNARALESVQNGVVLYAQIQELRRGVMAAQVTSNQALGGYSDLLWGVVNVTPDISVAIDDRELVNLMDDYSQLDRLVESMRYEQVGTQRILSNGAFGPSEAGTYRTYVARTDLALEDAQTRVIGVEGVPEVPDFGASVGTVGDNRTFDSIRTTLLSGLDASVQNEAGVGWPEKSQAEIDVYDDIRATVWNGVLDRSNAYEQSNLVRTIITTVATLLAIALTVIIALVIARRIINPLRRLTTTATAVRQELPRLVERVAMPGEVVDVAEVQIPVESQDEVGRLAEAFNGVNAATLAIASEQAALRGSISEMFVNVARRDQVLLNRQLASIDEMERTEDNPSTLTKLFALDHLATRMRRNSESLLVLAGIDTGRRLRRPMPLSDVIRTASSEIELYERVELELDADPAMVGHSALTAAHLFAELLENATVFSDPGTPVVVRTGEREGNYVVEISDSGIGMTEQELVDANARVASTAASEILGAQRLGLFVVGRIARRIGARVEISSKEGEGTLATITMSPALFDARESVDPVHTAEGAVDEAMHAPSALVTHDVAAEEIDEPQAPAPAAAASGYQPAVVAGGAALLAGRGRDEAPAAESVDDLIAADAAAAPAAEAVDHDALNAGVGANGLPTRRRRGADAESVGEGEDKNVIGLPARATAAQLSALEAEAPTEGFTPTVAANELSPQTPEQRASMFRGFRSRRDIDEPAPTMDPEAESLGQAARRGALTPDDLATLTPAAVPVLEDDEPEFAPASLVEEPSGESEAASPAAVVPAEPEIVHDAPTHTPEPNAFHMPKFDMGAAAAGAAGGLIVPGFGNGDDVPAAPESDAAPMVVPLLEDDDEFESFGVVAEEPGVEPGAEQPAFEQVADEHVADEQPAYEQPAVQAEPAYEQPAAQAEPFADEPRQEAAVPFSLADVYGTHRAPEPVAEPTGAPAPQYWGVEQVSLDDAPTAPPTIDEIIGGPADDEAAKSGFFSRLFGRGKKDEGPSPVVTAAAAGAAAGAASQAFAPVDESPAPSPAPEPAFDPTAFAPSEPAAPSYEAPAPAYEAPAPAYEAPAPAYEAPAEPAVAQGFQPSSFAPAEEAASPATPEPAVGGAFAYWSERKPEPAPHPVGQPFTPDELANPSGWEAAGASALAASAPEQATEYQPVVDINPEAGAEPAPDMTSAVFSELSSLTVSRPKVEKTSAGLQRRRAADAPPVEVKPIEPEVAVEHKERDAEAVRNRFSSFYSGTQRARTDVAEFEQRAQPTAAKE